MIRASPVRGDIGRRDRVDGRVGTRRLYCSIPPQGRRAFGADGFEVRCPVNSLVQGDRLMHGPILLVQSSAAATEVMNADPAGTFTFPFGPGPYIFATLQMLSWHYALFARRDA